MATGKNNTIREKQARIAALYSDATFALAADEWAKLLVEHFRKLQTREMRVLNWMEPEESVAAASQSLWSDGWPEHMPEWLHEFSRLVTQTLASGQNLHHPRYVGHQVPASIPIASLFDAIGSATNQVMAIYEMGPWATAVERAMIAKLGEEIGYAAGTFGGLITSGGSLANLTALLTARNVALEKVWTDGIQDARKLAFVVQEDVHYCVTRAAGMLGIGTNQIVRVPVNEYRQMRIDSLDAGLRDLRREGRLVVAVTAAACATPIGAFDSLHEVADVCERHQVWMHVDAAHGGAALLSDRHRHLVSGIERADSVVWDAHKLLFMPALCAFAFYKNKEHRFMAFQQDAPYLFDPSNPGMAEFDSGTQTLECTKRAAAYGLWGIWSLFGRQLFGDLVDVTFEMAQVLYSKLASAADFQPLHEPQCNIQVFRYTPDQVANWSVDQLGQFQLDVRRRVITRGKAYIVPVKIDGVGALRATLINPCTTGEDLDVVLDEIRACGMDLLAEA